MVGRLCDGLLSCVMRRRQLTARSVRIGEQTKEKFPPNVICNQKYNIITFIPVVSWRGVLAACVIWSAAILCHIYLIHFLTKHQISVSVLQINCWTKPHDVAPSCFFSLFSQVLFEQFRMFLNLFFLIMATSQFIEELRVGYLYTYWAPLVSNVYFVKIWSLNHVDLQDRVLFSYLTCSYCSQLSED